MIWIQALSQTKDCPFFFCQLSICLYLFPTPQKAEEGNKGKISFVFFRG